MCLLDESFADMYLSGKYISNQLLKSTIRQILNNNSKSVCVVAMGSALKNKGKNFF